MVRSVSALCVLLVTAPATVLAGPVESPGGVDIKPGEPMTRVMRYDYSGGGLLLSDDGGDTWRLMCGTVIDSSVNRETTNPVIADDGSIYVGSFSAMWRGSADGCSWEVVDTFDGKWIKVIVRHPGDPSVLFAVTSNGGDVDNGIYRYDAGADAWSPIGLHEPALIRAMRVVEIDGGGLRFYQSIARGTRPDGASANYIVRYSDDEGATWTESEFGDAEGTLALLDVDASNPDRVAISITGESSQDRVLVSASGGAADSWVEVLQPQEFGGGAFGPDGQLWLGDIKAGLYVVPAGADTAEELNAELRPRCVEYDAEVSELFVCGLFDSGTVDPDSGELSRLIDFRTHDQWLQCDGESIAPICEPSLGIDGWCGPTHFPDAPICEAYGFPGASEEPASGDAGSTGGDGDTADAGATGDGASDDGCGCSAPGGAPAAPGGRAPLALLALTALIARRRRA